jgi:hypothetical protein
LQKLEARQITIVIIGDGESIQIDPEFRENEAA